MNESPRSPPERMTGRPPSRSPSPMSMGITSAESDTSPRPSRDTQPLFDGQTESQELQTLRLNHIRERTGEYKAVAAEDASASHVQRPTRKIKMTTILTDCIVILLPLALVVFVALVWSKRDSRVNEEDFTSWENAIKVVSGFQCIAPRIILTSSRQPLFCQLYLPRWSAVSCPRQLTGDWSMVTPWVH